MRAWRVEHEGGPEALAMREVPEPTDGVVVDVRAAGVGFPDLLMSRGEFQLRRPLPFTLGWEAAGVVVSAPSSAPLRPGDAVVTISFGAFAERLVADPGATFRLPQGLSFEQGAALPLNYLTALAALDHKARVQPGEQVLVHGAGGGVGSAVVQVAKALGARVIALVSGREKLQVALDGGADAVVVAGHDWRREVLAASAGGVDVVVDPVGGDRLVDSLRCLTEEGRLVVVGFAAGEIPMVPVNRLLLRNADVLGCSWSVLARGDGGIAAAANRLSSLVTACDVRPIVGRAFPFGDLPAALRSIADRRATGKVVVVTAA